MKDKATVLRAMCVGFLVGVLAIAVPACDFERNRALGVSGLLGFLAQISRPSEIVVGRYCGQTASLTGAAGGFTVIDTLCQSACGSTTAHLCSGPELQGGLPGGLMPPGNAWYGGFIIHVDEIGSTVNQDCGGWSNASAGGGGSLFDSTTVAPNRDFCNASHPFACCDYVVLAQ